MKNISKYWLLLLLLVPLACQEEFELTGTPPNKEDAAFTYAPSEENDNIINFSTSSDAFMLNWDFGNGATNNGSNSNVTATYPTKGEYEVTLTVYNSAGSASTTQTITIAETDPTLLDIPVYNFLTGGADDADGKTWVVDRNNDGHLGIGPSSGTWPEWYAAKANEKEGTGLYDDEMTFKLQDFGFEYNANGNIYVNAGYGADFPNAEKEANGADLLAPYTDPGNMTWTLTEVGDDKWELKINGGHLGYYSGASPVYEIISLSENELYVRSLQGGVPGNVWYQRFVPEGYSSPVDTPTEPEPETSNLPIDFEGDVPPFNGFGGTTYEVVDNPDASGINTSAKVGKYVKGTEGNWAGIETFLDGYMDFSTNTLIKYKVYSPVAGKALFKFESADGTATPIEVFADVTKVNEWQELTFDFSAAESGIYDKIAMFLDFDNNNGGTFYIDDIQHVAEVVELTEDALTGGSSKSWSFKPAAGAVGVGPAKGSTEWFGSADLSTERPCWFNDEFIFKAGGEYEYNANGDIYGEAYMGVADGCQDESTLTGTGAEPWASGIHSFSFTPATGTEPAYITVTGTGAFIGFPKPFNGGEYADASPVVDGSVTYEVLSYVKNGDTETLALTIDIGGGTFWNYILVSE